MHGDAKYSTLVHRANRYQSWDLNPCILVSEWFVVSTLHSSLGGKFTREKVSSAQVAFSVVGEEGS